MKKAGIVGFGPPTGKANLAFVEIYLTAPFGKYNMTLPLVIEKGYENCRGFQVLSGDFPFLIMGEDFFYFLFHRGRIISPLGMIDIFKLTM